MLVKYFSNRELAHLLAINLAKWKRWSREFLPPDPLGGYRSGYARQYSLNDAWEVFIGGHLVAGLKFTIPEARQITLDLYPWFKQAGLFFDVSAAQKTRQTDPINEYQVTIYQETDASVMSPDFCYVIRGYVVTVEETDPVFPPYCERFFEWILPSAIDCRRKLVKPAMRVLPITQLRTVFCEALRIPNI